MFAFKINYNQKENATAGLFNGNITETLWRTRADNVKRKYAYQYDDLNRLLAADYSKPGLTSIPNNYAENINYDKNGNISALTRYGNSDSDGMVSANLIDNLKYFYDTNKGNVLVKVLDLSNSPQGFNETADVSTGDSNGINDQTNDYSYDANGNMTKDTNKGLTSIIYNHLNLPTKIVFSGTTNGTISYLYNALGQKVQKKVVDATTTNTTDYLTGFQYKNAILDFFPHAEGYVKFNYGRVASAIFRFSYVFNYTDHLGNIRVSYSKDQSTNVLKILEENHYYPFGLKHTNYNSDRLMYIKEADVYKIRPASAAVQTYKYKYNGKELQEELGLNMYDYGARNYDPSLGRWMNIDPLAETSRRWSPYTYAYNNPMRFVDPDGMQNEDWVKWRTASGDLNVTYDAEIKTQKQAEDKGYSGVEEVFRSGIVEGTSTDGAAYSYKLNDGGSITDVTNGNVSVDSGFTTPMGTHIGENKSALSQLSSVFQDVGDGLTLAGVALSATGFGAVVGGPMMAIGGAVSLTGTGMELADNYNTGTLTTEKVVTKVLMEAIPIGSGRLFNALGEPAANKVIESAVIGVDRALDVGRDSKVGPYRKN